MTRETTPPSLRSGTPPVPGGAMKKWGFGDEFEALKKEMASVEGS